MARKKLEPITKDELLKECIGFHSRWRPASWVGEEYSDAPGPIAAERIRKLVARYKRQLRTKNERR